MTERTVIAGIEPSGRPLDRVHRVAVLAFDGVVLGDLAAPCELLGRAVDETGRSLYDVRVCGEGATAACIHLTLQVPGRLAHLRRADTVIIPGMEDIDRVPSPALLSAVRRAVARGARVASICSGAFILAATGALDGLRATTHWLAAAELARRYSRIEVDPNVLYVDNGLVLTSAGAVAGFDLCLHMIRRDFGARVASRVARMSVMPLERAGGQAQFITHAPPRAGDGSLAPLLVWLREHLADDLSLEVVARRAAMSPRTLSRHFGEQVGATPASWIVRERVRRAQQLLEETALSIDELAVAVGFRSASVLRAHFTSLVGTSPQHYRRSFQSPSTSAS